MRTIDSLDEIKKIEYLGLKAIDTFCNNNGIDYFLIYGTLLGARRHNGFIPWDDDIDIAMRRDDYERFIKQFNIDGYKCKSLDDPDYFYPFAKVYDTKTKIVEDGKILYDCGVYVDVFPIDVLPSKMEWLYRKKIYLLQHMLMIKYSSVKGNHTFPKRVKRIFLSALGLPFSIKYLGKKINKICKNSNNRGGDYCANIVWGEPGEKFPKGQFEKKSYLTFEGALFPCPYNSDDYLTQIYGDYMKLPPEEKRVSNHSFQAFFCD